MKKELSHGSGLGSREHSLERGVGITFKAQPLVSVSPLFGGLSLGEWSLKIKWTKVSCNRQLYSGH